MYVCVYKCPYIHIYVYMKINLNKEYYIYFRVLFTHYSCFQSWSVPLITSKLLHYYQRMYFFIIIYNIFSATTEIFNTIFIHNLRGYTGEIFFKFLYIFHFILTFSQKIGFFQKVKNLKLKKGPALQAITNNIILNF